MPSPAGPACPVLVVPSEAPQGPGTPILDAPFTFPLCVPPPKDFPWLCLLPAPATESTDWRGGRLCWHSHVPWFTVQGH